MSNFSYELAAHIDLEIAHRESRLLKRLCADHNLDYETLASKYLTREGNASPVVVKAPAVSSTSAVKEPKVKKATVKGSCTALTSKGDTCKFKALDNEQCMCKRHFKMFEAKVAPVPKEPKVPKPKKVVKKDLPMHSHSLSVQKEDCDLCSSHGNPLSEEHEFIHSQKVQEYLKEMIVDAEAEEAEERSNDIAAKFKAMMSETAAEPDSDYEEEVQSKKKKKPITAEPDSDYEAESDIDSENDTKIDDEEFEDED